MHAYVQAPSRAGSASPCLSRATPAAAQVPAYAAPEHQARSIPTPERVPILQTGSVTVIRIRDIGLLIIEGEGN